MEILKPGRPIHKPNEDYRGECEHCGCQVKCSPKDMAVLPYSRSNPIYQIKCPNGNCGGIITLKEYIA